MEVPNLLKTLPHQTLPHAFLSILMMIFQVNVLKRINSLWTGFYMITASVMKELILPENDDY